MSLAAGARLGPYEIVSALGAGGMGEVYRARDLRLGRDIAIKVLPSAFSADPERLARFEQEARAAAALNHPNILAVHDVGQHDGSPYIVSELLEGETLRDRLNEGVPPVRKTVEQAVQIAHGLAAAHEKAITHRDLKPENVFITSDGRVKILDFGLAKLTEREPAALAGASAVPTLPPHTVPGLVLGTVGYMAPEQVRGLAADHRADIFAFGVVLYEMLSGGRAFRGDTEADTMTAILKEDPPDLSTSENRIPPALARIVDRCLEKAPSARFQSTRDLAFALEGLSSQSGSATPIVSQPPRAAWLRIAWSAVAVSAVALLAALPVVIAHLRETPVQPASVRFPVFPPADAVFAGGGGYAPAPTVSPDGRLLVFMARRGGGSILLWVRSLDSLDARPMPGTEGAIFPFWSPDSKFIGFFADGKLKKIEISGGPAQVICDAPAGEGGTWNRDGVIVFAPTLASALVRVSALGGEPEPLTTLDASQKERSHGWPQFLPDGRRFTFFVVPDNAIHIGSLDSSVTTKVLSADSKALYVPPGYLLFMRQGSLMAQPFDATRGELRREAFPVAEDVRNNSVNGRSAFSVSSESGVIAYRSGTVVESQLIWFDRAGRQIQALGEPDRYTDLELSPDQKQAVVAAPSPGSSDLWLFDVARGLRTRFTLDAAPELAAIWSPDGGRLVFGSQKKGGPLDIYQKAIGTGTEEELYSDSLDKYPFSWSADGRFILYGSAPGQNLWTLPLFGERKPIPFMQTPSSEFAGRFSPDGRWVAYRSDESGRFEIYVAPFPGPGAKARISAAGATGGYPRWRRDGKELFYLASDNTLMAAAVNGQGTTFEVGEVQPLFQTSAAGGRYPYDVSADGQRFLVLTTSEQSAEAPVTVVVNWTAQAVKEQPR